jgi:hypothetical protein
MSRSSNVRMRFAWFACCAALLGSSIPRVVLAEPSAAELASARDFMKEGRALRAKGDHEGALKKFLAAFAVVPTPITGLAVAEEQVSLGQLVEARETVGEIDRMPVTKNESDAGKKARADAAALLTDVVARIPVVAVHVSGAANVTLTIDGRAVPLPAAEQGFRVNPGAHAIVASAAGRPDQTAKVDVVERERRSIDLAFPTGTDAPIAKSEPPKSSGSTKVIGLVTAGVGVVALGVGGVIAFSAKGAYTDARDAHCTGGVCDADGKRLTDDARTRANTATIVMGVGAVLAVGGAILWLTAPSASESKTGITHVNVGLGSIGIGGSF